MRKERGRLKTTIPTKKGLCGRILLFSFSNLFILKLFTHAITHLSVPNLCAFLNQYVILDIFNIIRIIVAHAIGRLIYPFDFNCLIIFRLISEWSFLFRY